MAVFVLAVILLIARLYDVQVTQHEVWATEAANLVRSYNIEPYTRGELRDRAGRVLARDQQVYELDFVWRDFRRGHPLGQVAMGWSSAFGAPISLEEAQRDLVRRASALVELTPDELEAFARGAALALGAESLVPDALLELEQFEVLGGGLNGGRNRAAGHTSAARAASAARRRTRAGDLVFYVYRLLALSPREERQVRRYVEDSSLGGRTYVELASMVTGVGPDRVRADLVERLAQAVEQLARLAQQIEWGAGDTPDGVDPGWFATLVPEQRLVTVIEARRAAVEDDTADALFGTAVGCPPWRFDQQNLGGLELGWLDRLVGWDPARRLLWIRRRGADWPKMVDDWIADYVIARAKLAARGFAVEDIAADGARRGDGRESGLALDPADALLSALAHAFRTEGETWSRRHGVPADWRTIDDLEGLATLPVAARTDDVPRGASLTRELTFQAPHHRRSKAAREDLLVEVLGPALERVARRFRAEGVERSRKDLAGRPGADPLLWAREDVAKFLIDLVTSARQDWDTVHRRAVGALLEALEVELQAAIAEVIVELTPQDEGEDSQPTGFGAVSLVNERIGRAEETRRYVVRDRGSRPRVIGREPGYELVHLVTRHPREFAGFRVRPTTRRVRPTEIAEGLNYHSDGIEVAEFLVGEVRHPYLVDLLRQRPGEVELAELQRKLALPEADREEILDLVESAWHPEERIGGSGFEGWFDRELRGVEGYSEFQGLQDRKSDNRAPIHRPPSDGRAVWLTLDLELQRAAEALLRAPEVPLGDPKVDQYWFLNPVGAIVLATVEGEVLVAASTPLVKGLAPAPDTDGQRRIAIERTLRRPLGEPPGSIIKPLVAAWSLQHLGVDFKAGLAVCSADIQRQGALPKGSKVAGWGLVNCNSTLGHSRGFGDENGYRMNMQDALKVSCNTYFAALGETRFDGLGMRAALEAFGLGSPTGVCYDPAGRVGLVENSSFGDSRSFPPGKGPELPQFRQLIANGLQYLNVNVVQMARAYAALATGELPTMRLVRRIGDEDVPTESTRLPIDDVHLVRIRSALHAVVHDTKGSAHDKGISPEDIGVMIAGKTGSADYREIPAGTSELPPLPDGEPREDYMRKHTWFAGYLPSNAPRFVLVVFMHDTAATASHSATYIAGQFLRLPEVKFYLEREGLR